MDNPQLASRPQPGVRVARDGPITILRLDNPPVNALNMHLRRSIGEAFAAAIAGTDIRGIVLVGAGDNFVAGSDISEFGTPRHSEPPLLPELCSMIEDSPVPVVAAIHGRALGGGCELALACHHRVAGKDALIGLPEVSFGFIPGSGGTVRLPRLVGPEKAVEMIVSGKPISAPDALAHGLVDAVSSVDLLVDAVAFLRERIATPSSHGIRVQDREDKLASTREQPGKFEELASALAAKARGRVAPIACIEAVRNAFTLPFDEALRKERETFIRLMASPESRSLRHLFFAERQASKILGVSRDIPKRDVSSIGIVGAGTMGTGMAMAFANSGFAVTIVETTDDALQRGVHTIERTYDVSLARGSITADERRGRLKRISGATDLSALAGSDLIVEAVFEDMATKKKLFSQLGAVARPGAILATNTSYLDVNEIAASSGRPADFVGLHFFSPANVMKLLEIVRGSSTAPDVIATALGVARKIGKVPVVVGVCRGFVGNRMLAARSAENENLLLDGATPVEIDRTFTDFGWPMGPFQMGDLAGLDISWRNRKALGTASVLADSLCERGHFGQKSGRGWYLYQEGYRTPMPNPDVIDLIEAEARRRGIIRRKIDVAEIIERTHYPMIKEGLQILQEGIAARASDIDLIWVHGYGFPSTKGGVMHWAQEEVGFDVLNSRLAYWKARTGNPVFEVAAGTNPSN